MRTAFSGALLATANTIINAAVLFVLYRYVVQTLGAKQLGLWSIVIASTSIARLSELGFAGSLVKFVSKYRALGDHESVGKVVQTGVLAIAFGVGLVVVVLLPISVPVVNSFVPQDLKSSVSSLIPLALISLWIGSIGSAIQSALDGSQRIDLRVIANITGQIAFLAIVWNLLPHLGILSLAYGQIAQGAVTAVVAWGLLKRVNQGIPIVPWEWSRTSFLEMWKYGLAFQINSFLIFLFDPVTKWLLATFGSLEAAGFFEMANQMVQKVRQLVVSANQALVPYISAAQETVPGAVQEMYVKTYRVVMLLVVPAFTVLALSTPLICVLWVGTLKFEFVYASILLAVGWAVNVASAPAYFSNLGIGDLRPNTEAHALIAIANVLLGAAMGSLYGGEGVIAGFVIALILGSVLIIARYSRRWAVPLSLLIPPESRTIASLSGVSLGIFVLVMVFGAYCKMEALENAPWNRIGAMLAAPTLFVALISPLILRHPIAKAVFSRFQSRPSDE